MGKQLAIRAVNGYLGRVTLTPHNTCWSRMHVEQGCWWLNIQPEKFSRDLNLCLDVPGGFVWLHLPPNHFCASDFQRKSYADARRNIELRCHEDAADFMADRRSGNQFSEYVRRRFDF